MLHFILGPSGSGKTTWIRRRIAELVRQDRRDLLLLVPEQNNFESERAVLSLLGSASTDVVEVVSFTRLAEWAQGRDGGAKPAAPDSVKVMVMGRALRAVQKELTVYGGQGGSPEFCRAVLQLEAELRRSRLSAEDLRAAAPRVGGTLEARLRDLSLLIEVYRGMLQGRYRDPLEDLDRLTEALDSERLFAGKTVFIDSFKGFTEQQYAVLERVIAQSEDVCVALLTDGLHDDDGGMGLFSNVKRTAAELSRLARAHGVSVASPVLLNGNHRCAGTRLINVERLLRGDALDRDAQGGGVTVCRCANAVDEADTVARTIRRLVRTEGYRYREFAVVARKIEDCQSLLVNAFERYGIPCFNDRRVEADSLALVRFTLNAIDCAMRNYPDEAILPLIKSELSPMTVSEASELENYVLTWKKRGRDWLAPWEENPNGLEGDFDAARLERILDARRRVTGPIETLRATLLRGEPKAICRAVYNMLISMGVDRRLAEYADRLEGEGDACFADLHRRSWDVMMSSLDAVVRTLDGDTCDKEEFYELFSMLLTASDLGAIPDRLDEVVIGSADHIRMSDPRVLFVIGANYGVFPASVRQGGLLSDHDRRRLLDEKVKISDSAAEQTVDERFMAYAVLTAASERLFVTYRSADLTGAKMMPAEFIETFRRELPDVSFVSSQDTAEDALEGVLPAIEYVCGEQPVWTDALSEQLRERSDPRVTLLDAALRPTASASLSPDTARRLFGADVRMSASRAETYESCPFHYFCKYGIKARPDPSSDWAGTIRGSLVHEILETMLRDFGAGLADLPADKRLAEIKSRVDAYADAKFGRRDRLSADFTYRLERAAVTIDGILARLAEELSQSGFRPDAFELPIGQKGYPTLSVPLRDGSGNVVDLHGKIDRVDVYREGDKLYVRIVDYKTGDETFDLSDLLSGSHMQMLFYLFAVLDSERYAGALPAGVLYQPATRAVVSGEASYDPSDRARAQDKELRMRGVLLKDDVSLSAMERSGEGHYIPYPAGGKEKHNAVVSREDFDLIRRYILHRIAALGARLHEGRIGVAPRTVKDKSPCKYCDYASVCRFDERDATQECSLPAEEALDCMKKEVDPDEA